MFLRINFLRSPHSLAKVVGILGMDIPHLKAAHAVVVDEIGVVDPATNAPEHVPLQEYLRNRAQDGVVFHTIWLGIKKS